MFVTFVILAILNIFRPVFSHLRYNSNSSTLIDLAIFNNIFPQLDKE